MTKSDSAAINEALDQAGDLRKVARELHTEANEMETRATELEREWVGVAEGDILSVRDLVRAIQRVREERGSVERSAERDRRSRTVDALPQPRAIRREVHELALRVHVFASVYALEHEALASLGSSDVHVQTGPSDTTVSSLMDRENEAARDRCRQAVKLLRRAESNVEEALRAFGPLAEQPTEPSRICRGRSRDVRQSVASQARRSTSEGVDWHPVGGVEVSEFLVPLEPGTPDPTTVYRLFGGERLLYVGITNRGYHRLHEHAKAKPWWQDVQSATFEHFPTRQEALWAEADAIWDEDPAYNVQMGQRRPGRLSGGDAAGLSVLTREELLAALDRQTRLHFEMSGLEFLHAWHAGEIAVDDERFAYVVNLLAQIDG